MNVIPFQPEHVTRIALQPMQAESFAELTIDYGKEAVSSGPAFTAMVGETVVACGGIAAANSAFYLWALLSLQVNMLALTRIAQRLLDTYADYYPLYAAIRSDFPQAHRWARMLGLELVQQKFVVEAGVPMDLYKRTR